MGKEVEELERGKITAWESFKRRVSNIVPSGLDKVLHQPSTVVGALIIPAVLAIVFQALPFVDAEGWVIAMWMSLTGRLNELGLLVFNPVFYLLSVLAALYLIRRGGIKAVEKEREEGLKTQELLSLEAKKSQKILSDAVAEIRSEHGVLRSESEESFRNFEKKVDAQIISHISESEGRIRNLGENITKEFRSHISENEKISEDLKKLSINHTRKLDDFKEYLIKQRQLQACREMLEALEQAMPSAYEKWEACPKSPKEAGGFWVDMHQARPVHARMNPSSPLAHPDLYGIVLGDRYRPQDDDLEGLNPPNLDKIKNAKAQKAYKEEYNRMDTALPFFKSRIETLVEELSELEDRQLKR